MNIAYVIFSNDHGTGGHHHSLNAIQFAINNKRNFKSYIINIGTKPSPILNQSLRYYFLKSSIFNIPINILKIIFHCKKNDINILHAFDVNAYFYTRIVSIFLKLPTIYTKCGGSNNKYNPKSIFSITFSQENYEYLLEKNYSKYLYLIENRIPNFYQEIEKIETIKKNIKKNNEIIFLRITRISKYYEKSISTTINFVANFKNSILVIIGSVYDEHLLQNIKTIAKSKNVKLLILNGDEYTRQARNFISLGDYVFGSGRAAMEALATKSKLLAFVDNLPYPVVVTPLNFNEFRYYNFSERVKLKQTPTLSETIDLINTNLQNIDYNILTEKFHEHYLIDSAVCKYEDIYHNMTFSNQPKYFIVDFFKNFYFHFLRCANYNKFIRYLIK